MSGNTCRWCGNFCERAWCSARCYSEEEADTERYVARARERAAQAAAAEAERRRNLKAQGWSDARIDEHDRQVALEQARAKALEEEQKQQEREARDRKFQAREAANANRARAALVFGGIPGGVIFLTSVGDKYLSGGWFANSNGPSTVIFFLFGGLIGSVIAIMAINTLLGPVRDE